MAVVLCLDETTFGRFWKDFEGFGKFQKCLKYFYKMLEGFEGEFGRFWEVLDGIGKDSSDLRYVVWS